VAESSPSGAALDAHVQYVHVVAGRSVPAEVGRALGLFALAGLAETLLIVNAPKSILSKRE